MQRLVTKEQRLVEFAVILICAGLICMMALFQGNKTAVLNLFYLPVVLAAFFLGRYRAGLLAFFCVIAAAGIALLNLESLGAYASPLVMLLSLLLWAAVLGMTAMLTGTLSDECHTKTRDLHDAYVGVIEVLAQYIQNANHQQKARAIRLAELSQAVAEQMNLSPKEVDEVRVAALLYDIEGVEITSKVIREAVGTLESGGTSFTENTFHGRDLVRSLGPILKDAMPLISSLEAGDHETPLNIPIGSRIISCVREYSLLSGDGDGRGDASHDEVMEILQVQYSNSHADKNVVAALRKVGALQSDLCFHPATC